MAGDTSTVKLSNLTPYLLSKSLQQYTPDDVFNVAILGVESTGKTTLCKDLATHFNTEWVLEFTRPYLEQKMAIKNTGYEWEDLLIIARGQVALENSQALKVSHAYKTLKTVPYLFCDTNLFELMIYAYWYYGACPPELEKAALKVNYDMILLTDTDVPWEADPLRDSPHDRDKIDIALVDALNRHKKPFRRVGGDRQTRVTQVAQWLRQPN